MMASNADRSYKVLIAGNSYLKCASLYRLYPWTSMGYKAIIEANVSPNMVKIQKIKPDILILTYCSGWAGVDILLDTFLRYSSKEQVILTENTQEIGLQRQYPGIQVLSSDELVPDRLTAALQTAITSMETSRNVPVVADGNMRDEQRLQQLLEQNHPAKVMLVRMEMEHPPEVAASRAHVEREIQTFLDAVDGGAWFLEQSGKYCILLELQELAMMEQLRLVTQKLTVLRSAVHGITGGRVCLISSALADAPRVHREYEQCRTLDRYRFFCADWPVISMSRFMQDVPIKEPDWSAVTACHSKLLEAAISGDRKTVASLLHDLFQEQVKKSKNITFYRVVMAQLRTIQESIRCITREARYRPLPQEVEFWSIEDAADEVLRGFYAVMLEEKAIGSINPLVLKTLMLLIREHGQSVYVGSLAKELGVSESYLSRIFKQQLGIGIVECMRYMRVYAAASDLLSGQQKLNQIAQKHGFSDAKYFGKVFRQVFHCSPTQWVNENKEDSPAEKEAAK